MGETEICRLKAYVDDITRLSYLGQAISALLVTDKAAEVVEFLESEEVKKTLASREIEITTEIDACRGDDGRCYFTFETQDPFSSTSGRVCLSFDESLPELIMITRDDERSAVLVLEKGRRHLCVCRTPDAPLELVTYTVSVDNRLESLTGTLETDFFIDILGSTAQRIRLCLDIRPPCGESGKEEKAI